MSNPYQDLKKEADYNFLQGQEKMLVQEILLAINPEMIIVFTGTIYLLVQCCSQ